MSFSKASTQPAPRDPALAHDEVGPGLYPGETVLRVDRRNVAVSVSTRWLEEGGAVSVKAWARAIKADGATQLGPEGQHVERDLQFTASAALLASLAEEAVSIVSQELMLAVLGEPATTRLLDGVPVPIIAWSDEVRHSVSIREAFKLVRATSPLGDAAALLGLAS